MNMQFIRFLFLCFILNLFTLEIQAQDEPSLVIDPQGHSSMIRDLIASPDGTVLISLSDDKTIRFWDVRSGTLKKTMRGQIGEGSQGKLYAGDISPDGKLLAVAGWLADDKDTEYGRIRVINLETGKMAYVLSGHTDVVFGLAFSPDGSYLASCSADNSVRVWSISASRGNMLAVLKGHSGSIQDVAFVNPRRVVSVAYDNTGIVWDWESNSIVKKLVKHTDKVSGLACSSDGKYIATAGYDRKIYLWDNNGNFIKQIDEAEDGLYTLAFSADSKKLLTHGSRDADGRVYTIPEGRKLSTFDKHDNTVVSSAFITDKIVATAGGENNDIYIWDAQTGAVLRHIVGKGFVKRTVGFDYSNNNHIGFGSAWGGSNGAGDLEFSFNFDQVELMKQIPDQNKFSRTKLSHQSKRFNLADELTLDVEGAGQIVSDPSSEGSIWSYTFDKTGKVVVGTSFTLQMYSPEGAILQKFIGHTGETWAVAVSPDGKKMASANGDQTVKIWSLEGGGEFPSVTEIYTHPSWMDIWKENSWVPIAQRKSYDAWIEIIEKLKTINRNDDAATLKDKLQYLSGKIKPLATLFIGSDEEWVCWTPEGYYAASAGGEKYIGWHINKGVNSLGEYYPVSAFRKTYYQPELVKLVVQLGNFDKALAKFNQSQTTKVVEENILSNLPPKIEWLNPTQTKITVSGNKYKIKARITSDSEIKTVKLMINGRAVGKQRGFDVVDADSPTEKFVNFEIMMDTPETTLLVFAENQNSGTLSEERTLVMESATKTEEPIDVEDPSQFTIKPNLYAIFVGVSNFQKPNYNLEYADDDALTLSSIFKAQAGKFYNKVEIKELVNETATRSGIIDAFDWLEKNATHKDMVVIFIASHGFNEKDKFYILPHDGDHERLRATAVDWLAFSDVLGNLPSKVMLFLDACHSGKLSANLLASRGLDDDNTEAIRELSSDEHGVVVMTASTGNEKSLESPEWKHGAFTLSIIEALQQGKADIDKNGIVYLHELDYYVAERVKVLTNGRQHPTTQKPGAISRLPILQVK